VLRLSARSAPASAATRRAECQRCARAEAADDARAGQRGDGEQDDGKAVEEADLGARHVKVGGEEGEHRRHGHERDARAGAGEPEERERAEVRFAC
jgi:hypothetical protein